MPELQFAMYRKSSPSSALFQFLFRFHQKQHQHGHYDATGAELEHSFEAHLSVAEGPSRVGHHPAQDTTREVQHPIARGAIYPSMNRRSRRSNSSAPTMSVFICPVQRWAATGLRQATFEYAPCAPRRTPLARR